MNGTYINVCTIHVNSVKISLELNIYVIPLYIDVNHLLNFKYTKKLKCCCKGFWRTYIYVYTYIILAIYFKNE